MVSTRYVNDPNKNLWWTQCKIRGETGRKGACNNCERENGESEERREGRGWRERGASERGKGKTARGEREREEGERVRERERGRKGGEKRGLQYDKNKHVILDKTALV